MKLNDKTLDQLDQQLEKLIKALKNAERSNKEILAAVCDTFKKSARNLVHYYALRSFDITKIQRALAHMGMSRLARAEAHILASLLNTRFILAKIRHQPFEKPKSGLSIKNGQKLLSENTEAVLGPAYGNRRVRIMVTMPSQAADNYDLVLQMVESGMNCARINCAHDNAGRWKQMIEHVQRAGEQVGRPIRIFMDLAGPKIRTGEITDGPRVKKFSPKRDTLGQVIDPFSMHLVPAHKAELQPNEVPVDSTFLERIKSGQTILLRDTRGKKRKLEAVKEKNGLVWLKGNKTTYVETGTLLWVKSDKACNTAVADMPAKEQSILLREGDTLVLHKSQRPGEPADYDAEGNCIKEAHIACTLPEIIDQVRLKEKVYFDDGKIAGKVIEQYDDFVKIEITQAGIEGSSLKAEKGINFPQSKLKIAGLTTKDKEDLAFVAQHADAVNYSFVNTPEDVKGLIEELEKLGVKDDLAVILKIETQAAFRNLKAILLTAMQIRHVGVMIARGDLAVEAGWQNIGLIQKEIVKITSAAHIPVIWATQVLENLAKKGYPSRSEITDATSGVRAECVMLNKGPYINRAIRLLDEILVDMEPFQSKNIDMLPKLQLGD